MTSLKVEDDRSSELLTQLSHEKNRNLDLQTDLSHQQIQICKLKDALEREQSRFISVTTLWHDLLGALEEEKSKNQHLSELLERERASQRQMRSKVEEVKLESDSKERQEHLLERLQSELNSERDRRLQAENGAELEKVALANLQQELDLERKNLRSTESEYKARVKQLTTAVELERAKSNDLQGALERERAVNDKLRENLDSGRRSLLESTDRENSIFEDMQLELDSERAKVNDLKNSVEREKQRLQSQVTMLESQSSGLKEELEQEKLACRQMKNEIDQIQLQKLDITRLYEHEQDQVSHMKSEREHLRSEIKSLKDLINEKERTRDSEKITERRSQRQLERERDDQKMKMIQRLYGKYLRADSYRKALVYQKKYLLLLLGGFHDSEQTTLALIARSETHPFRENLQRGARHCRPFTLFRSAVRVVVAVSRMRFLVRKWKRATRVGSPVMGGTVDLQQGYTPDTHRFLQAGIYIQSHLNASGQLNCHPSTTLNPRLPLSPYSPSYLSSSHSQRDAIHESSHQPQEGTSDGYLVNRSGIANGISSYQSVGGPSEGYRGDGNFSVHFTPPTRDYSSKPHPSSREHSVAMSVSYPPTSSTARQVRTSDPVSVHDDYINRLESLQQRLNNMDSESEGENHLSINSESEGAVDNADFSPTTPKKQIELLSGNDKTSGGIEFDTVEHDKDTNSAVVWLKENEDSSAKFQKKFDNTQRTYELETIFSQEWHKSVAHLICGDEAKGTAFRVGSRYLMTAFHVIEENLEMYINKIIEIIQSDPQRSEKYLNLLERLNVEVSGGDIEEKLQNGISQWVKNSGNELKISTLLSHMEKTGFSNAKVQAVEFINKHPMYVYFGRMKEQSESQKYPLKTDIPFYNEAEDVVLLEVNWTELPNPFKLDKSDVQHENVNIIGHPGSHGNVQILDSKCPLISMNDVYKTHYEAIKWWKENCPKLSRERIAKSYDDMISKKKVLFHCSQSTTHGASGSPGIIDLDKGSPKVYLMLQEGYPGFAHSDMKEKLMSCPKHYLVESGISMLSVYSLLSTPQFTDLRNNIFHN